MLEVSGGMRDGAIDSHKATQAAIRLGADAMIIGTVLDLSKKHRSYSGYTQLSETVYTAKIRARFIDLSERHHSHVDGFEHDARKPEAEIAALPWVPSGSAGPGLMQEKALAS